MAEGEKMCSRVAAKSIVAGYVREITISTFSEIPSTLRLFMKP